MEVKVTPPPPPPPPPSTYDLIGLTEDEVTFLHDVCGRFSCSFPPGEAWHFHRVLFEKLDKILDKGGIDDVKRFLIIESGRENRELVLACKRMRGR